ncbi:hypothetical protein APHAL10511_006847 [Amanita phalloides]|nr:hypothetical protein APHAL10511_006847 [Amanita phalloides]
MSLGYIVHVVSQQRQKDTSHTISFPIPEHPLVTSTRQTPSFLLSRYPNPQDLSIGVPLHANVHSHTRSPVKASAISTGAGATILSPSSLRTPISLGLLLALPGASTYAASVSSLTSLAFDPASTASILSSPSIASSKYSSRQVTTSDGLTPSTSTTRHPLEFQGAITTASLTFPSLVISINDSSPSILSSFFPVLPSEAMPTTTITTSQATLTMPITTVTPPLVLSPPPSSSTDTSTTTSGSGPSTTTSTSHSSLTSSTSLTSSRLSSSTTTFFTTTSNPGPIPSVTNVSMTSTYTVPNTAGLAPSARPTSTVTTIQVITSTLRGGRTTVVESRVLSTSDPVLGSRFSHNTGAIIGVAVSATLGVILSVFAVFFSCTRYRNSRDGQLYGRQRRYQRHRNQKGFGNTGAGWLGGVCGRKHLSPIPAGPIFTQTPRSRSRAGLGAGGAPGRVNSTTRILGNRTPDDAEDGIEDDEVSWRPSLPEEVNEGPGRAEYGGGVIGGIGYPYGQGPCVDMHGAEGGGVVLPTPAESGEWKRNSSHGHSQSWGHASSGHGHTHAQPQLQVRGTGMESALLPPGSGIPLPLADSGTSTMPAVVQYVACGYPGAAGGVGVKNLGNLGDVGVELPPAACFGSHTGTWMGLGWEGWPNDGPQVRDEGKRISGGAVGRRTSVIGIGGLVTPRTSEGDDLSGAPTVVSAYDTTGSGPVLEQGSGFASSSGTGDDTWATTRVASTSSRRKSITDVLGRFRTLSSSTRRTSNDSGRASALASALAAAAAVGGGTNGGGVVTTRPGYDYGAIMRPQQRQTVLEHAIGHYQQQMQDGPGYELKPPPSVMLANHEMHLHLRSADSSGERVDQAHGRGAEEDENEDKSLDTRRSVVRDKLLDPCFLSPGRNGSSPNIEGASLRDYVDYSRRIGGIVKDHSVSTATFDTVDQDGASVSAADLR